jgi:hypothetical protein
MSSISFLEKRVLERVLRMESGYVLNFSDKTIANFVADTLGMDFTDARYQILGTSKANRLRAFWQIEEDATVARLLRALIDYAMSHSPFPPQTDDMTAYNRIVERLAGRDTEWTVTPEPRPMYNLIVSGPLHTWDGRPFVLERDRCLEFTDREVRDRLGCLDATAIATVVSLPSVFAYERHHQLPVRYGRVTRVVPRERDLRFEYQMYEGTLMSAEDMRTHEGILGIREFEVNRHHWAIKEVDLLARLADIGITLPTGRTNQVDITTHQFDVGLSFAGETRPFVADVATGLDREIGRRKYFYDDHHKAQLARPSVDVLLQDIYRNRCRLVVAFIGSEYERKDWCGLEFRVVREIVFKRQHDRVMYVRMDDGDVTGVLTTDGYVDAREHTPDEIARLIRERLDSLPE